MSGFEQKILKFSSLITRCLKINPENKLCFNENQENIMEPDYDELFD